MSTKLSYLRLSVTDQCDMACSYCIPYRKALARALRQARDDAVARDGAVLTVDEIGVLVDAFAHNRVTKVRLTGGEPLVRDDVVEIVRRIAGTAGIATVGLTTNGVRLHELAPELARAGLQRVNISVDSLNRETFQRITGADALDEVLRGIDAAIACGFERVKLNTVVMRGVNDSEIASIADFAGRLPVEARFIELMPLGCSTEHWRALHVPAAEIRAALGHLEPLPYENGSSARRYRREGSEAAVGIISPMSEGFCDGCNRIRVTCSGKLKPCLRLPDEEDLRPLLHAPDLTNRLAEVIGRLSCHKLSNALASSSTVQAEAMCAVGG